MAPNEHLLDNFGASKETRTLAGQLLREAQVKTAPGSGHEIGTLSTGLPAVCILIASERLNNGDVTKKVAQAAACLKPKDFTKVYTQVQSALETTTIQSPSIRLRRKGGPMRELPSKDSPKKQADGLQQRSSSHPMDIEVPFPELDNFGASKETRTLADRLLREVQVKTAPGSGHEIGTLSTSLPAVCILIASERLNNGDITKKIAQSAACLKPKDFTKVYTEVQSALETTTIRSPSVRLRRKNELTRELPSKDSPKKRQADDLQQSSSPAMDIERPLPETPTKKRKIEFTSNSAVLSKSILSPTSPHKTFKVTPARRTETAIPSTNVPSSPLKRSLPVTNSTIDLPPPLEESEVEDLPPPRRFRPVYLDCKQWNARDPRLARIWKKAETHKKLSQRVQASVG